MMTPAKTTKRTTRTLEFRLYPAQRAFATTTAHYAAFIGGVGSGKSYAGCLRALRAASGFVGERRLKQPVVGMVTAPTYTMLRDATLRTFLEIARPVVKDFHKSEMLVTLTNGAEVLFRTADDPDRLRGPNISWWYGDEAALYDEQVWRIMLGRLRQHGQRGYAWITTTPKGRNWIYREFVQTPRADYALFHARTADNHFLDPAFIASLQTAYSGDFARQELDGEFVAYEGLIYPEFRRDVHLVSDLPRDFRYTVAGVDWGYANPGVMLVFGVDGDGRMWGLHEEVARQRRIEEWAAVAAQLNDRYSVQTWFCDPSEPDFIAALAEVGCAARAANNRVLPGIQAVKNRLVVRTDNQPRLLFDRHFTHLAAEMDAYEWLDQRDGVRDEPKKAHDHTLDALRYAVIGVDTLGGAVALPGGVTYADDGGIGGVY